MISATAGVDPETNELAGPDVAAQTTQILNSGFAGSDLCK
jgi:hypothetical protein